VTAKAASGHAFFETSKQGREFTFKDTFEIPIWDIYTVSSRTLRGTDEHGSPTAEIGVDITNLGKTPTPGPVAAQFSVHNDKDASALAIWQAETFGPVSDQTTLLGEEKIIDEILADDIIVKTSLHLRCPDGKPGDLHDGDTSNNRRDLVAS